MKTRSYSVSFLSLSSLVAISSVAYACQFLLFKKKHLLGTRYVLNAFSIYCFLFFFPQCGPFLKVFIELVGLPWWLGC